MVANPFVVRAGATARRVLAERGFDPDAFSTLVGASGGPKWLVLRQLDTVWVERLLRPRTRPLTALGSSIGSFRHACLAQSDPHAALARFFDAYVGQRYVGRPTPTEVSDESERILRVLLGEKGAHAVVASRVLRNHFVASRLRGATRDAGLGFQLRIGASAVANAFRRGALRHFYERAVFGPAEPDVVYADLPTRHVALTPENVPGALRATGSIPFVMRGVPDIAGTPGLWFDGGIVDYHFDFRFRTPEGLVLFPHFFDRITPGWFDKALPWRRPRAQDLDRVVMVAPSDAFVASLPGAKVPDRNDFETLDNDARIARWREVDARCRELADAVASGIESDRIAEVAQPFA